MTNSTSNCNPPVGVDPLTHVLNCLTDKELCVTDGVSRFWNRVAKVRVLQARAEQNHCPRPMPDGISHKQFQLTIPSCTIGERVISDLFGDIENVPPMSARFVVMAFQCDPKQHLCVYIPSRITVTSNTQSLLKLDSQGRLIEDPAGRKEAVSAAMTLNNMGIIVENCNKKKPSIGFSAAYCSPEIFIQHGNTQIPAHWTLQRKFGVERIRMESLDDLTARLASQGLKMTELADRAWAECCFRAASGRQLHPDYAQRTSTPFVIDGLPHPPALWWRLDRLVIENGFELGQSALGSAVAVEIPAAHCI